MVIPDSVTALEEDAFSVIYTYRFNGLNSITFGQNSGLLTIAQYAFRYRQNLKKFVCPASVTTLSGQAFYGANACDLIMLSNTPPTISQSFANDPKQVYVPYAVISTYKSDTNWTAISSRINPLVATVSDLSNIDTTTYTKAYVQGADRSFKKYTYDGSAWNEV